MKYLVDGMNVIGSRPDGWWRDRAAARIGLVRETTSLVRSGHSAIVFFDGRPGPDEEQQAQSQDVTVYFAPGGPNAADDRIVEYIETTDLEKEEGPIAVVTSDATLARRARRPGVDVMGAGEFRRLLEEVGDPLGDDDRQG